jgi:hypothetical protein
VPDLRVVLPWESDPIFGFDVKAKEAIPTRQRLRALTDKTGLYPMAIAEEDLLLEMVEEWPAPRKLIKKAGEIDAVRWLKKAAAESGGLEAAEWPDDTEPNDSFGIPFDVVSGKPLKDVKVVLLPTKNPWEVAAYLGFSAVNYDIEPQHHVAVHRRWFDAYGAEPAAATGDVLEFSVARPPKNRKDAMTLAGEQYAYCPDIVEQGVETLEALAATVLKAPVWFFWWD